MQTDRRPLLNPHPTKAMYDIGLITSASTSSDDGAFSSSFSLLPKRHSGRHKLPKRGVSFAHESASEAEIAWCKLEVAVPFSHVQLNEDMDWERSHGRVKALRATEETPLFCVHHEIEVDLTCVYDSDVDGQKPATERLVFAVPVTFACVAPQRAFSAQDFLAIPAFSPCLRCWHHLSHPGRRLLRHRLRRPRLQLRHITSSMLFQHTPNSTIPMAIARSTILSPSPLYTPRIATRSRRPLTNNPKHRASSTLNFHDTSVLA